MIITIDGPAGTGKTTIAKRVSQQLKCDYFDTGAMYRALTYQVDKEGLDMTNEELLMGFLKRFCFDIRDVGHEKKYFANGEDVTDLIRTPPVTRRVSEVSAHPSVRGALITIQQEFSKKRNVVFEGRDMGTVVFPKADFKFFLTARPAVRAERRYFELKEKQISITPESVLNELIERDHFDSTREIAPLKQADDAYLIDTSDLTIEEVAEQIVNLINKK